MKLLLIVLAATVASIGGMTMAMPGRWLALVKQLKISTPLRLAAFAVRVVIGVLLILVAGSTRYPLTLEIIGAFLILAGVLALVLGNDRVQAIVDWFVAKGPSVVRVGGAAGLALGLFLVYALI